MRNFQRAHAVEAGQLEVGEDQVELPLFERVENLVTCFHSREVAGEAVVRQEPGYQLRILGGVLDMQNLQFRLHPIHPYSVTPMDDRRPEPTQQLSHRRRPLHNYLFCLRLRN
jgi:hypothetical protein